MNKQSEYWAKNVLSWEKSAYYKDQEMSHTPMRFWDRVSSFFRGDSIYKRADHAFEEIKDHIKSKTIVDVGCASGRLARRMLDHGAAKVYGIDISEDAVALARKLCEQHKISDEQWDFQVTDVTNKNNKLPQGELTVSLGVIEYFDHEGLTNFMTNLNTPYYFLSFPLKQEGTSLRKLLRSVYLRLQSCPGIYFYTLEEFKQICQQAAAPADARLVFHKGSIFVSNLPESTEK